MNIMNIVRYMFMEVCKTMLIYGTAELGVGVHTHTQLCQCHTWMQMRTDAGNDSTRKPKLDLGNKMGIQHYPEKCTIETHDL